MAKRADVWPRRKNGRIDSWYFRKLRLKTKDAGEARHRARLAQEGKWPPKDEGAAKVTAEAFTFDPPPAPTPPPPAASSPPDPPPAPTPPPPISGDWTTAATAAAADGSHESNGQSADVEPEQISSEQLAELVVSLQLKGSEVYVQQKYFESFIAPEIAPQGRAMIVGAYRKIFDYSGSALQLPPWVNGLVVPGLTVVVSSMAIVAGFREAALEQKQRAEQHPSGGGS